MRAAVSAASLLLMNLSSAVFAQLVDCSGASIQHWVKGEGGVFHLQNAPRSCLTTKGTSTLGSTLEVGAGIVFLHCSTTPRHILLPYS
jgi:hypothetical protein